MKARYFSFVLVLSALVSVSCSKQEEYNHVSKAEVDGAKLKNANGQGEKIAQLDQDDPDNTNFIVGNGRQPILDEKSDQGEEHLIGDPSLFLTLNEDARNVSVYVEGYPDQKVYTAPAYQNNNAPSEGEDLPETNLLAVDLSKANIPKDAKLSLIVLGEDNGRKTKPLDLTLADETDDATLVKTATDKKVPNFNVELGPLQTISGNLSGNEMSDITVAVAGTRIAVNEIDSNGNFNIDRVPPGGDLKLHVQRKSMDSESVLLPFSTEHSENIDSIDADLKVRSVCNGFLRESIPKLVDFPPFKAYQASSEDAYMPFKSKFEFKSKSTLILSESKKMAICDIKIFLFPQRKNYFYTNKLLFTVNDNLLYTQMKEKNQEFQKTQGILSFLGLRSIPPIFKQQLWQTGLDLLRMVMFKTLSIFGLINEPLVIGFKNKEKPSVEHNMLRGKQLRFDIYCNDTPRNCSARIDKISMELDLANTE